MQLRGQRMSDARSARGGEFATSRRGGLDQWERAFVNQKRAAGCSDFAIAKMLARSALEIRAVPYMQEVPRHDPPRIRLEAIERVAPPPPRTMPKAIRDMVSYLASCYEITFEDLVGQAKAKKYTHPRHEAFARVREIVDDQGHPKYSFIVIGQWFGGRDHSTVLSGVKAHRKRTGQD